MTETDTVPALAGQSWLERVERATAGWLRGRRSAHTRAAYTSHLRVWTDWCAARGISPVEPDRADCAGWVASMVDDGAKPATVRVRVATVRSWLAELTLCGLRVNLDPFARLALPRVDAVAGIASQVSTGTVIAMLDKAREFPGCPAETAIGLCALMGLRADEAGRACAADLQVTPWGLCLLVQGKGGKAELLPVSERVLDAAGRCGWPGDDLATFGDFSLDRARNRVGYWVRKVADAAGIVGVSPHGFRHWFVTTLLEAGVELHHVQDAARHADPGTTRRYDLLANNLRDRRGSVRVLDAIVTAEEPRSDSDAT